MLLLIKKNLLLIAILLASIFLRLYSLNTLMQFIPDQGWFYLSARDMLLTGKIPLVGPETSHPWIHHGPLWTYTLAVLLLVSRFNPVGPAYFIGILGTITVWLFYYVCSKMFSKRVGFLAAAIFAVSPLIVLNARIPYHTSPIPFFVIILFYLTYLWIKGIYKVFPFITLLLGVLYNHEITTFVFDIAIVGILLYGIFKKKNYAKKILQKKIIFISILLFTIPMIPFIIYDMGHGYKQTFGFLVWVLYRVIKFPLGLINKKFSSDTPTSSTVTEFFSYYKELIFPASSTFTLAILLGSFLNAVVLFKKKISVSLALLGLFFLISIVGLFLHRIPIEADTLLISPFFILFLALLVEGLLKSKIFFSVGISIFVFIVTINVYIIFSTNFFTKVGEYHRLSYMDYLNASEKTIDLARGKKYNIKGKGELSNFPVFLMPYEYILWWKGYPVSKEPEKTVIQISETKNGITVLKMK